MLLLVHTLCLNQFSLQLDTTYTHSWCTHCALISCTAVHLYFSPVCVHSGTVHTTALYNCTLASASLAYVLSTNHRRASIYMLCSDWSVRHHHQPHHPLIAACLPRPFPRETDVVKSLEYFNKGCFYLILLLLYVLRQIFLYAPDMLVIFIFIINYKCMTAAFLIDHIGRHL